MATDDEIRRAAPARVVVDDAFVAATRAVLAAITGLPVDPDHRPPECRAPWARRTLRVSLPDLPDSLRTCRRAMLGTGLPCGEDLGHAGPCRPIEWGTRNETAPPPR